MYNSQLKIQYIEENEYKNKILSSYITTQFTISEETETNLGKDLSCFTVSEILAYYKSRLSISLETLVVMNNHFERYTDFCIKRGVVPDMQNHYREINNEVLMTCVNIGLASQTIISRDELMREIKYMYNPSDKFVCLAIFEGICGTGFKELYNLRMADFNGNDVYLCTGRKVSVSNDLVAFAKESADTYELYGYGEGAKGRVYYYDKTDLRILKRRDNYRTTTETAERRRVQNILLRIKDFTGSPAFTKSGLKESGRIEMIRHMMAEQGINDLETVVRVNAKELEERYGAIMSIPRFVAKYSYLFNEE